MNRQQYAKEYYEAHKDDYKRRLREWREKNPHKGYESHKRYRENSREKYLLKLARTRAKTKGIEFNIELSDIVIPEVCPYLLEPFVYVFSGDKQGVGQHPLAPSLDRIDPSKGYIKGNIRVISSIANKMKWNATPEQLVKFAEGVLRERRSVEC